ncbi:PREDICTED: uncharacterized protein LOC107073407 [Polistes dominula]|uniref:Uncharacterized protein LOC107073407 n=1 Tax=Polistes dominula TaxID=743375 RepID=A0ABM1JAP3_POLDO|nr:PREDICTED: uncharacterized protein LOC107073407 [Polistes dominula]
MPQSDSFIAWRGRNLWDNLIPSIDFKTYKRCEEEVGNTTKIVVKKSYEEATELERELTLENLSTLREQLPEGINSCFNKGINITTFDTVVQLMASHDMGWSTRRTGRNYDSLNGFGAIVGIYSQAVLDYSTCNKKCKKYDAGHTPFDHDCRMNFSGSAKAMEAHAANQLINKSSILNSKTVEIGVTKHLYAIEKNHHELKKDSIKYLHRCFSYAMIQNKGNSKNMAATIRSIPYHAFNKHEKCGQWCSYIQDKENYDHKTVPGGLTDIRLFDELKTIFDNVANNAEKFSVGASSNVNESLNASMASKTPKSKCLSLSASSNYRYASIVCQKNLGINYTSVISSNLELSPGKHHKKNISRLTKTKVKRAILIKTQIFKKNRLLFKKKRSALRHKKETLEETTYESNLTLLQEPAAVQISRLSDEEDGTLGENIRIMFFDIETTGLQKNSAHKLNFDGPRLCKSLTSCNLIDELSTVAEGFIDTLKVIRKITERTGKGAYTITNLAKSLNISCADAHDATKDVAILEKIIKKLEIDYKDMIQYSINYHEATNKWLDNNRIKEKKELCYY